MVDTFRELCAELKDLLDMSPPGRPGLDDEWEANRRELLPRARAALDAAPDTAGGPPPTRRQLMLLAEEMGWDEADWPDAVEYARAVLDLMARYGTVPVPPAEGEVAELVAALRTEAEAYAKLDTYRKWAAKLTRAADLLEQRQQPRPMPVAERWPTPEDCDAAQAVRSAAIDAWGEPRSTVQGVAAAALRAAADAIAPACFPEQLPPAGESTAGHYVHGWVDCQQNVRRDILAIATELEAGQ